MSDSELQDFRRFLESHGADRARWPAAERLRFATLLSSSAEAHRALADEEAFDAVLQSAPGVSPGDAARAADRLMARLPNAAATNVVTLPRAKPMARPHARSRSGYLEAGLLAASLMIGVLAGTGGYVDTSGLALLASNEVAEADHGAIALGFDETAATEEDLL
ncbi:MAG: hypothetical protein NW216_09415 [Hyphomicrobium sp.]|nr:hypothetical protein [Hyphomicrobium sp.]